MFHSVFPIHVFRPNCADTSWYDVIWMLLVNFDGANGWTNKWPTSTRSAQFLNSWVLRKNRDKYVVIIYVRCFSYGVWLHACVSECRANSNGRYHKFLWIKWHNYAAHFFSLMVRIFSTLFSSLMPKTYITTKEWFLYHRKRHHCKAKISIKKRINSWMMCCT